MHPDNWMAAEPLLIARLRAVLPQAVHILSAAELARVAGFDQPTPAVHVLYQGYQVADTRSGAAAAIDQSWLTIIHTRHVADIDRGFHARQSAGHLAAQVMDALYRHRLKDAAGKPFGIAPMRLTTAPAAGYLDGDFYLPLGWLCPVLFASNTCPA